MKPQPDIVAALRQVPGWDPSACRITELKGGLTNRVYHVRREGRECVLRLDTRQVGHDRRCEQEIMEHAAEAGLAPAILYVDADAGIFMTEYLHGRAWRKRDLESRDNIQALAELLRQVHALPACGSTIDLAAFAAYYAQLLGSGDERPAFASHCVRIVDHRSLPVDLACCHNDVVASNVIEVAGLRLIDWEYAGDNEPLFDLASVIGFHDLDAKRRLALLGAYAGRANAELEERLAEQMRLFDAIQWLWLAARQRVSPRRAQLRRLGELQRRIR